MHATNKRYALEAAELKRLDLDEGWTMARLATHFAVGASTIKRRLAEVGITARQRGPFVDRKRTFEWSPELAYAVGVIATDGNLSGDRRHLTVTSKDVQLLEVIRDCLQLKVSITPASIAKQIYHIQWGDRHMWDWLTTIGLMPAKSLRLAAIAVPHQYFADFMRGCIDGDGSIITYTDRYLTTKSEKYVYQRLFVSLVSASPAFLRWIRSTAQVVIGVKGALFGRHLAPPNADMWQLKYAKRESVHLLRALYYQPQVPCLLRKKQKALPFLIDTSVD